jgi:hypothetical protein
VHPYRRGFLQFTHEVGQAMGGPQADKLKPGCRRPCCAWCPSPPANRSDPSGVPPRKADGL